MNEELKRINHPLFYIIMDYERAETSLINAFNNFEED